MQTVITKTSIKGNEIRVYVDHTSIIGSVDGVEAGSDRIVRYPVPAKVGDVLVAGYLNNAKIGLTSGEIADIEMTIKANRAAQRRAMNAPINRNQPYDLAAEMEREDSAW
jgi:hypothetical protein